MSKNVIIFLVSGIMFSCQTQEPTRWMGPSGNGHYTETGLLKTWPVDGPEILWTYDSLGMGFSSAVIQNGYLFTTGMTDSTGYLYKINLQGELVYKVPYGTGWTGNYKGTRGSPTVVGDRIYLVSGRGKLICFSNEEGTILWSKEYFTNFDGENIMWGINESPVVDGNVLYATPGGAEYNVVALDRYSGDLVWKCKGEGEISAYCTPLLIEHNGRKILTTYTEAHLLGIDATSGELLWSEHLPWEWSVHSITAIYHNGEILYPTGLEKGGGKLQISEDGSSVSVVWENQAGDYRYAAILVDGYLFESFSDHPGFSWRCIDWDNGRQMYASGDLASGRAIYADGMLYLYTSKGELALVKPDPEEFRVVSQTKITHGSGLHQAQPMMYNGVLYVRHGNAMMAYKVKS